MSGVFSKVISGVNENIVSPLTRFLVERTGVSDDTAKYSVIAATSLASTWLLWKLLLAEPKNLPPGPRPLPLFGNLSGNNID